MESVPNVPRKTEAESKRKVVFAPLKKRRAFEEISIDIKRMIFSGKLKPGDALPSEGELAAQFCVSRRRCARRCAGSSCLALWWSRRGASGGPFVVDTILESIGALFVDAFLFKRMGTSDLTEARLEIEKMVLNNVFKAKDSEAIARMRRNEEEAARKLDEGVPAFEENLNFHKLMASATGNFMFVILMESTMTVVAHFHSVLRIGVNTVRGAHKAHLRIIDAELEKGDQRRAEWNLEKHILAIDDMYINVQKRT